MHFLKGNLLVIASENMTATTVKPKDPGADIHVRMLSYAQTHTHTHISKNNKSKVNNMQ